MKSRHFKLNLAVNELCKKNNKSHKKNHTEELQPCRVAYLKGVLMWHLGTGFSGGLGSTDLMVGFDGLRGVFQPQ